MHIPPNNEVVNDDWVEQVHRGAIGDGEGILDVTPPVEMQIGSDDEALEEEPVASASRIPVLHPRVTAPPQADSNGLTAKQIRELKRLADTNKAGRKQTNMTDLPDKRKSNLRK